MTNEKHWSEHRDLVFNQIKELQKRISELEAPKSCGTCMAIGKCEIYKLWGNEYFYCSDYEPKDNQ